jgi:signal transduction histidine kinase
MNVASLRQARLHETATRGADVDDVARSGTDGVHRGAHGIAVAPGRKGVGARDLVPAIAVVALSVPVIVLVRGLTDAGLSHWSLVIVLAIWSLAEVPLLLRMEQRRTHIWPPEDDATAELLFLGAQAASAEATVRRNAERFHELRSTVAGIGTTYRLLRDRPDRIPDTARTMLESLCETELARLERLLVDDSPVATQVLEISTVVDPLVEALRFRGHQVARDGVRALAVGRPDDIAEIVNHLLENAVRHAPDRPVMVRVCASPTEVTVSVTDHGPGVSADLRPHLFERGAKAPDSPGEGIGLHISRRLAREMGGDLRLDVLPSSGGATFTLSLPSALAAAG